MNEDMGVQSASTEVPAFDTKLVVVVLADLATWQKVNAAAFLVSGIAASDPTTVGEPYEDASGGRYLPMFRQPALVFEASREEIRRAFERATERGVELAIFTDELFGTPHDEANRAAVRTVERENLSLVGIAFRSDRRMADKVTKGLKLHR